LWIKKEACHPYYKAKRQGGKEYPALLEPYHKGTKDGDLYEKLF